MASTNYDSGVPNVLPDTQAPNDLSNVQPAAAEGLGELGAGVQKAAAFYNSAAADNAFNDYSDKARKLLYGDPSKPGPDGQPDLGFLGLKGAAAMQARPQVEATLDSLQKDTLGTLTSDEQRQAFEVSSRRYRNTWAAQIGSHTDQQSTEWYGQVNTDTAKNALNAISTDPLNVNNVLHSAADLTNAYVKIAQLKGAQPGDAVWTQAIQNAKTDAFKTQIQSIGATDPARALRMLQKSPDLAGTDYPQIYSSLRTAALDSTSDGLAKQQFDQYTATNGSPVQPAGGPAGQPAWLSTYLDNVKAQESGGNADAKSATSSATGLYQFTSGTWRGLMASHPDLGLTAGGRTDPGEQEKAVRAFTADNAKVLTQNKVPITPGNLYLSAFFGAQGAAALYDTPGGTPMEQAMPANVLQANSWLRGKTVGEVRQWAANHAGKGIDTSAGGMGGEPAQPVDVGHPDNVLQFPAQVPPQDATDAAPIPAVPQAATAGTVPVGSQSAKASMIQSVLDAPQPAGMSDRDWNDVQQQAITKISQRLQYEQIAADQTTAQKKAANDAATNKVVTSMLSPGADFSAIRQQIVDSPDLTGEAKLSLTDALAAHADRTVQGAKAAYGDGYYPTLNRLLLPPGDPNRISDPTTILKMAMPGPNGEEPAITLDGVSKLQQELTTITKSPDGTAITTAKAGLLSYAKQKMTYSHDPFYPGDKSGFDFKGESIFNGQFIPKFEKAYSDWIAAGKAPFDFLTQENVDKLAAGLRNPHEMAMEKLAAMNGNNVDDMTAPPAPEGIDPDGWKLVVNSPPMMPDGKPSAPDKWTQAVSLLQQQPTPERMALFDSFFGKSGVSAKDVLDVLGIQSREMTAAEKQQAAVKAPAAAAQAAPAAPGASGPVYTGRNPKPLETKPPNPETEVGAPVFPEAPTPVPTSAPISTGRGNLTAYPPGTTTETTPKKGHYLPLPPTKGPGGAGF